MTVIEKLKVFKEKDDKYYLKAKDNSHIDIEHKDKKLKFKLHKWDKEASIEVTLDMVEANTHTFIDNRIEIKDSKQKLRVYPIDSRSTKDFYGDSYDVIQVQDGGIRYEVEYLEKPSVNFYYESLVCKNTKWSLQNPLTQQEIEEGVQRPLNVDYSYSVYHATKKHNKYKTGKMLHRYRPIAIDALGNKAWCSMEVDRYIDPTSLKVTIPQQFLDEATYPVTIDPDFGYTDIGGTDYQWIAATSGWRRGSAWTMVTDGQASSLKAYVWHTFTTQIGKAIIYEKDSIAPGSHGQVAAPVENVGIAQAAHWEEWIMGNEALDNGETYILTVMGKWVFEKGETGYVKGDEDGAVDSYQQQHLSAFPDDYANPSNPWVRAAEVVTIDYSIYIPAVGWSGKISGITDPAKIMGIEVSGIAKVKGIE